MTDGRFTHLVAQFILTTIRHIKVVWIFTSLKTHCISDPHLMVHQWTCFVMWALNWERLMMAACYLTGSCVFFRQVSFGNWPAWRIVAQLCAWCTEGVIRTFVFCYFMSSLQCFSRSGQFLCCLRALQIAVCCKFLFQLETAYFFKCVFLKVDNYFYFLVWKYFVFFSSCMIESTLVIIVNIFIFFTRCSFFQKSLFHLH